MEYCSKSQKLVIQTSSHEIKTFKVSIKEKALEF